MPNRELFHLLHHDHHARYDRMFPYLWAFVALTLLTGFALDTPENIFLLKVRGERERVRVIADGLFRDLGGRPGQFEEMLRTRRCSPAPKL